MHPSVAHWIPVARRCFRLVLPLIVFVWTVLPSHACANEGWTDAAAKIQMAVHCDHCPPHDRHCVKPGPGNASAAGDVPCLPVGSVQSFVLLTPLARLSVRLRPRWTRGPIHGRPLHLEKRVLLI